MNPFATIGGKIASAFLAVLIVTSIPAVLSRFATAPISASVDSLIDDDTAALATSSEISRTVQAVEADLQRALRQTSLEAPLRARIQDRLGRLRQLLDAMVAQSVRSKQGQGTSKAIEALSRDFGAFDTSVRNALAAHDERLLYMFAVDGKVYDVHTFALFLKDRFTRWMAKLDEAARFDAVFTGNTDPAAGEFPAWVAAYKTTDAKLAKLIAQFAKLDEKTKLTARQITTADRDTKIAIFEKQRGLSFQQAGRTLDLIIEYIEPVLADITAREADLVRKVEATGEIMTASAETLDKAAREAFEAHRQDVASVRAGADRITVLSSLLAIGLAILLVRGLARPIRGIATAIGRIRDGESDVSIPGLARRDELGDVSRSVDRIRGLGRDNQLVVAALNGSESMLMITDAEEKIVFISAALVQLLMTIEPTLRTHKADFSISSMFGQHIDFYGDNVGLKREVLDDDGQVRKVRYDVAGLIIAVDMTYITSETGQRLGHTLIWRNVTQELAAQEAVSTVVNAAAAGNFSERLDIGDKKGFVREIAVGLNALSETVEVVMSEFGTAVAALAEGNLSYRTATRYGGIFGKLQSAIEDTVARLSETIHRVQQTASSVSTASGQIQAGATDLAKRSEEQAAALEEIAATTEELAASIKTTANSSRQVARLAEEATATARRGGGLAEETATAMGRIEQASAKIGDITAVIEGIAFQTNLLALNAAVEAARAGEAGRGFAVVASEVRTLAQRSAAAAKDIAGLIKASHAEVGEGVRLVGSTTETLGLILESTDRVAQLVEEISHTTGEQASGVDEVSQAVAHLDQMTQSNALLAEDSAQSAVDLNRRTDDLQGLMSTFRIDPRGGRSAGRSAGQDAREPGVPDRPSPARRLVA